MQSTAVVDPEANERTDGVKRLPESHDLAADLWRGQFTDVDWAGS